MAETSARIVEEARSLMVRRGYNGFSYADIAERIGIRKASIHHHFAGKNDLARAVVEQSRLGLEAHARAMADGEIDARAQLRAYTDYWARCIDDDTAPFCVAAMLAAELPSLPDDVAAAVKAHFVALTAWLRDMLVLGAREGSVTLGGTAEEEAEAFLSAIYGAMLSARAFGDPKRFSAVADRLLSRVVALH